MKTLVIKMVILMMATTFVIPVSRAGNGVNPKQESQQKKKEKKPKKEKKEFDWDDYRPSKLSGDENLDNYILMCDTLWEEIQSYEESIHFYSLDTLYSPTEKCMVVRALDEEGNAKNVGGAILQGAETALAGSNIILDAANVTLATTNAGLSLVSNPLLAFGYTKCLKGGPLIVYMAYHEFKDIVNALKAQTKELKQMRDSRQEGSTEEAIILPMDESIVPPPDKIRMLDDIAELKSSEPAVDLSGIDWDELEKEPETPK
ncbi:MAG: hypothetical protein LBK96_04805 [Prevotellaceae bacterium]|jgi:hypothetical protein|nr:hypothetical protein [Prevotellaceae bacterium]